MFSYQKCNTTQASKSSCDVFRCVTWLCLPSVEALTFPPSSGKSFIMGADEALESELGLGELAGLTVANEADSLAYDVSSGFLFYAVTVFEN